MRTTRIIAMLLLTTALAACKNEEKETLLTLSTEAITVSQYGDTREVTISTDCHWTSHTDVEWITLNPTEGDGNATVTIEIDGGGRESVVGHVYFRTGEKKETADTYQPLTPNGTPQEVAYGRMTTLTIQRVKKAWPVRTPEVVDLGLSVKWGSFNLGATVPEEFGYYYGWGEIEPKENYAPAYYDVDWDKACQNDHLTAAYDAATANLGGDWRLPTWFEMSELSSALTWQDYSLNGVPGLLGTATNGNTIFFPKAGSMTGTNHVYTNYGVYLTSKNYGFPSIAFVSARDREGTNNYGYEGRSVRPVYVGISTTP